MKEDPGDLRTTLVDQLETEKTSAFQKYRLMFAGTSSASQFLKYELLTFLLGGMPGALGLLLRKIFFRSLFCEAGRDVVFGSHVTLRCPGRIRVGNHVYLDDQTVLDAKGPGSRIDLGDSVLVGRGSILSCGDGRIEFGNNVSLGPQCFIRAGLGPIQLGSDITVGSGTIIISGNPGRERLDIPMKQQIGSGRGITIGDDVWIGVGARVIDGATIGSGSVIGAGAVVIDEVPEHSVAAGVPAKILGSRQPEPLRQPDVRPTVPEEALE